MAIIKDGYIDISESVSKTDVWVYLGWQDIRQRYRRSVLGPWWVTLSTGIMVLTLGLLWSQVFNVSISTYLPFFSVGLVIWTFISGFLTEVCTAISQFEGIIKQRKTNFFIFIVRIHVRHLVILFHNFAIVFLVFLTVGHVFSIAMLTAIPGLVLLSFVLIFTGTPIAIFCTRFRDMPQIVANVLQVVFYVTPIIWEPANLKNFQLVMDLNPFLAMVSLIRKPMLGSIPSLNDFLMVFFILLLSSIGSIFLLGKYRKRIAYWL